ncbi:hypothetical protein [Enterococcus cecorum]|uniref:hypothetical protein n=1 Tax=Enterococcus cecorum TaxID=44008 RepID=UPI000DE997FB|nr:hypothetical protein [Enterococcus cecorum]RBR38793.1 hypothetical protein EB31_00340 [Enterococcus cecorum]
MEEYVDFLSMEEQKSIQLKALFSRHHFQNYRLSAFESYDLYAKSCVWQNKSAELCKGKMQSPALNFCA